MLLGAEVGPGVIHRRSAGLKSFQLMKLTSDGIIGVLECMFRYFDAKERSTMRTAKMSVGLCSLIAAMATSPASFAQTPYGGTPHPIPGVIQAEDFDNGGEGVAYHATSAGNAGGAYRNTDIDIYPTTDTNGVLDVALSPGEWLNYTVDVSQAGAYRAELRVSHPYGDNSDGYELFVDGVKASDEFQFPGQGTVEGNPRFDWLVLDSLVLPAGVHVLKLEVTRSGWFGPQLGRVNVLRLLPPALRAAVPLSGSGAAGFADGAPDRAQFSTSISGLDVDQAGNIYVADSGNLRLRKVSPDGHVTTLAGNGTAGRQNGAGAQAQFLTLTGVAIDSTGNCYVADNDTAQHMLRVREIGAEGTVTTFYEGSDLAVLPRGSVHEAIQGLSVDTSNQIIVTTYAYDSDNHSAKSRLLLVKPGSSVELKLDETYSGGGPTILGPIASGHSTNISYLELHADYLSGSYAFQLNSRAPAGSENELPFFIGSYIPPTGLALSPSGTSYVSFTGGIDQVLPDASSQRVNSGPGFTGPLATDYAGNVYGFQSNRLYQVLINYSAVVLALSTQGGGTVSASPSGPYLSNTVVQITATPSEGFQLLQWQGDAEGTNSPISVTMDTQKTIQGVFAAPVDTTSTVGGTVTRDPDLALYPYNTQVTITAQPDIGYEFLHWADGDTNKVRTFAVTSGVTLQAVFSAVPQFTLSAQVLAGTGGTVTTVPAQATYYRDSEVALYARPATGYVFQTWLDGDLSDPRLITVESNTTVFAVFAPGQGIAPAITTPPTNVTAAAGDTVTFNVAAIGSALLEYQWSHDGKPIPGETHTTLSLPGVQPLDAGTYGVRVYNSVASTNASATLSLISGSRPLITSLQALNGQIQFTIGGTAAQRYKLESSPDLSIWTPAATLTNTQGTISYSAPLGGGNLFYRASVVQ